MKHVREAKYCVSGLKQFFVKHNLDIREFSRNGLPEDVFLATNDAMAIAVVEVARCGK
jgi:hypothetical protein